MSNPVYDSLVNLAACLCEQIRKDDLKPVCFCGVLPGAVVAHDYVGVCDDRDGMAWVRLVTGYPADGIGRLNQQVNNCGSGLGLEIELGMLRSAPTMREDRLPPTEETQAEVTETQMGDMLAMWRAVACCFDMQDYILRDYRPFGPQGFAVGGTFAVIL